MHRAATTPLLAALLALAPAKAAAHTVGISKSTFTLAESGVVEAEISLSVRDLARLMPLDRDGDGLMDAAEVQAHKGDFEGFVRDAVDVFGDGAACPGTLVGTTLGERGDGVEIRARYACKPRSARVAVTARYMTTFDDAHRHAASLVSPTASKARVLTVTDRQVELDTGFTPPAPANAGNTNLWAALAGVLVAAGLAFAWRKRRRVTS